MCMELKNQVVSLELAKRLKELGVKQESAFVWAEDLLGGEETALQYVANMPMKDDIYSWAFHSAFTVAELGNILPLDDECNSFKTSSDWAMYFVRESGAFHKEYADTEADARAKMLIYLLENNLLPTKEGIQ